MTGFWTALRRGAAMWVCAASLAALVFFVYAYQQILQNDPELDFYDTPAAQAILEEELLPEIQSILESGDRYLSRLGPYDLEMEIISGAHHISAYPGYKVGDLIFVRNPYSQEKESWVTVNFQINVPFNYERTWNLGRENYTGTVTGTSRIQLKVRFDSRFMALQEGTYRILRWGYDHAATAITLGIPMFLVTLLYLVFRIGWDPVQGAVRPRLIDKAYLELWVPVGVGLYIEMAYACSVATGVLRDGLNLPDPMQTLLQLTLWVLGILLLCALFCLQAVLSFVVRLRAGTLGQTTLIVVAILRFFRKIADICLRFTELPWVALVSTAGLAWFAYVGIRLLQGGGLLWLVLLIATVCLLIALYLWAGWQVQRLLEQARAIARGERPQADPKGMLGTFRSVTEVLDQVDEGLQIQVEERMKSERMRSELITNVSHDIKTPLTSFISYVNLMEKEESASPKIREYTAILSRQAQRLKTLTDDLFEMSKAASGTLKLVKEPLDLQELMLQAAGDYGERLEAAHLTPVMRLPEEPAWIEADGAALNRVLSNLLGNMIKYAMAGTRVYLDLKRQEDSMVMIFRNISGFPLDRTAEELMERFTRGDNARATEGSGLGLFIARQLTELNGGTFTLTIDGDLFRVDLEFPAAQAPQEEEA